MDNLIEQLRDFARSYPMSSLGLVDTTVMLERTADTIAAQARLLALAETLAELAALRKVAEAARTMCETMHTSTLTLIWMKDTVDALMDLDAIRNRKEQPNV